MPGRVPPPEAFSIGDGTSTYNNCNCPEVRKKYEEELFRNLTKMLKEASIMTPFLRRLTHECENIKVVVRCANKAHIWNLEEIVKNLKEAETPEAISLLDTEFHRFLFTIPGDSEVLDSWRANIKQMRAWLDDFWKSMNRDTVGHEKLMDVHQRIVDAIKDKNEEAAVEAMLDHFTIQLSHWWKPPIK